MKKLEELDISPTPWELRIIDDDFVEVHGGKKRKQLVVQLGVDSLTKADGRFIAAAPKMYDVCYRIERWEDYAKAHHKAIEPWSDIMHDLHHALAEAAGEGGVK